MFNSAHYTSETSSIPAPQEADVSDAYVTLDKKLERKLDSRSWLSQKLAAFALIIASIATPYWTDVESNRAEQAAAEVSINFIGNPIDEANEDNAIVFIDGFNTSNADYFTKIIGPAVQQLSDGKLMSLGYNNALLGRESILKKTLETLKKDGIKTVSFVGYSMGGIVAIELAADVVTHSDINVNLITPMHTPNGFDGLQPNQKNELGFIQLLADWVPGAVDSSWIRFAGELYFYKDNYTKGTFKAWDIVQNVGVIGDNIGRFSRTASSVWATVNDPEHASMKLLTEQGFKISEFDMSKEMETIANQSDEKQTPLLMYVRMSNDALVNDEGSSEGFREDAYDNGVRFYSYYVPDAIHSQYYKSVDEYMRMFDLASQSIKKGIADETAKHAFFLLTQQNSVLEKSD